MELEKLKDEDVKYLVDLVSRKTIHDFNELDKEEELNKHKDIILENLNDESRFQHSYLFNQNHLDEEVKNYGLAKGFVYLEDDKFTVDTHLEYKELKELYKDIKVYEYAFENNLIQDTNLDVEYLRKNKLFDEITKDDFYSNYDIERIKAESEDELYYLDFKNEIDNKIKTFSKDFENESDINKDYINNKIDDIYYGIYLTKADYSTKYSIDTNIIDSLHEKYDLNNVLNNIEQAKLNQNPEIEKSINKSIEENSKEYEIYIQKYYETKDDYDFSLAGKSLANKNLYSKISNQLDEKDINKDIKDEENIKRFSAKDNEKINRLKQEDLYRKLLKQMKKNEKFLNSTQSHIAYKSRANSDNISRSTSELNTRDSMTNQSQIDKTESNVRNTIQNTKTDNRIHRKKEDRDNSLER